ncbi:MAG: WGR domain-containing protein, partial [Planctomycetes bacterium]|nr:WGR domain-containing protein [Planctomycetota bacterium]
MSGVKAWREGAPGEPKFPNDFEVVRKAVLQVTDIKTNRNKYYAIELHTAKGGKFRVYTHYGRTDDLETNPDAGARESRYFADLSDAQAEYDSIYREKTSARKGYKELSLASAKIGSRKTFGLSVGNIDDATLKKLAEKTAPKVEASAKPAKPAVVLDKSVQDIVGYLYDEATHALTSTVNATITANGIETPLGVLTIGQIEKGQAALDKLVAAFGKKKRSHSELTDLSGEFYTVDSLRNSDRWPIHRVMTNYEKLRRKPLLFRMFTGLSADEFDKV